MNTIFVIPITKIKDTKHQASLPLFNERMFTFLLFPAHQQRSDRTADKYD